MRAPVSIALVAPLLLTACAARTVETYRAPATRSWVGQPAELVERVWGTRSSQEPDGEGGTILIYLAEGKTVKVSASGTPTPEAVSPRPSDRSFEPGGAPVDPLRQAYVPGDERARFWVDAGGTVYRIWFSGRVWKQEADKTVPPTPQP